MGNDNGKVLKKQKKSPGISQSPEYFQLSSTLKFVVEESFD